MINYLGMMFVEDPRMVKIEQFRFPKTKKKRIKKKFARNPRNYRGKPIMEYYVLEQERKIIGHPAAIDRLKKQLGSLRTTKAPQNDISLSFGVKAPGYLGICNVNVC